MRDDEPALWTLTQDYTGPDGRALTRHGVFARVRVEDYGPGRIRPHERTHPGPKEDRLRLTRATKANLSPIFSLYDDPTGATAAVLQAAEPFGEQTDDDGTVNRLGRVTRPRGHRGLPEPPWSRPSCSSPTATTATRPRASTPRRSAARASTATCSCASSPCRTRG